MENAIPRWATGITDGHGVYGMSAASPGHGASSSGVTLPWSELSTALLQNRPAYPEL